jgi:hypothetical protein
VIIEPIGQYHSNSAISHSKLEVFRRRPKLFQMRYVTKELPAPDSTAAFRIGSAAHCAILEADTFADRYVARPEGIDRRTKDGKAAWESFSAQHAGKEILDVEELKQIAAMQSATREHPIASQLLAKGAPELVWRSHGNVMSLQCRTDWFNPDGCEISGGRAYVADVKTIDSLDADAYRSFERSCFSYGYHRQAGFYLPLMTEFLPKPVYDFYFIVVEKQPPNGVAVFRLDDNAVSVGQDETIDDLRKLKKCIETNSWPNIPSEITELALPKWYANK